MPHVYAADSTATPDEVWSLIAEPRRWAEWAPHVRGAWNLGAPEVTEGKLGAAKLLGVVPIPARITDKQAGRSWTWRVGPIVLVHAVHPTPVGSRVSMTLDAPWPLAATYGPVISLLVRRLARVAASSSASASAARS